MRPFFGVASQTCVQYLEDRDAGGLIVEEVEAFAWEPDARPGEGRLSRSMAFVAGIGYSTA
eukprot:6435683-Lingulodinium_polyedra.AAC.1